jgi:hypothetical protein
MEKLNKQAETKQCTIPSVISRYFYTVVLFLWLLVSIITIGFIYHIVYKNGFSKISDHFEWLVDRVNGL